MNISVIIPAYNEEKRLLPSLKKIDSYLSKNFSNYEILVIDDGSKDKTSDIVQDFSLQHKFVSLIQLKKNIGKGGAVKRGLLSAKYDLVLFSDSDLATPIESIKSMVVEFKKGHSVVIASRNLKGSVRNVKQAWYRQLLGQIFPLIVRFVMWSSIKDTQCGFKLYDRKLGRKIAQLQTINRFSFDVEQMFIARKLGAKIKEVPVVWTDVAGSKVNALKDGLRMLIDIFRIRCNSLRGNYSLKK